jgi:CheY-like chemotaxis protein
VVVHDDTGELFPGLARYPDECEVVRVGSPEDAANELLRSPAHAVILNTTSPLEILPRIEEVIPTMPDTPVFGCSVPPQLERAREAGAADYLIKPITRGRLVEAIDGIGAPVGRVLVVDDDADTLRLVQRMLDASYDGVEVSTALSGAEALAVLRSNPQDLVLLDIVMPGMDGWRTLEEKRHDETIGEVPVILVSAQDVAERPPTSPVLLTATSGGLSIDKLLSCSLALSSLLLHPDRSPDPERVAAPDVSRA